MFDRLSNYSGWKIDLESLYRFADLIFIEVYYYYLKYTLFSIQQTYNLNLSSWLTPTIIDHINKVNSYVDDYYFGLGGMGNDAVPELIKLRGGSLLKDIVLRMQHKISCISNPNDVSCKSINPLKYYAYSAVISNITFGLNFKSLFMELLIYNLITSSITRPSKVFSQYLMRI